MKGFWEHGLGISQKYIMTEKEWVVGSKWESAIERRSWGDDVLGSLLKKFLVVMYNKVSKVCLSV